MASVTWTPISDQNFPPLCEVSGGVDWNKAEGLKALAAGIKISNVKLGSQQVHPVQLTCLLEVMWIDCNANKCLGVLPCVVSSKPIYLGINLITHGRTACVAAGITK